MANKIYLKGILVLLFLQAIFLTAVSQETNLSGQFILNGDLTKYREIPEKVIISIIKPVGGRSYDSVTVVNNKFKYQMNLEEPVILLFTVKGRSREGSALAPVRGGFDYISVFAIPSQNELILKDQFLTTAMIKGTSSSVSNSYNKLYNRYTDFINQSSSIIAKLPVKDALKSRGIRDSLTNVADETILKPFIIANPSSPVSIKALLDYASHPVWQPRKNLRPDIVDELLNPLSANFKALPSIQALISSLKTAKLTLPGKTAMNFTAKDATGKAVQLSDFVGKYVFLDFWASWCLPCRKENPNVKKLYEMYHDKGLVVLSVSLDNADKREAWLKAIKDDGIEQFVHVSELNGFNAPSAKLYDIKSIPTNFIVDPQGKFVARNVYGEELANKFAEIFSKPFKR